MLDDPKTDRLVALRQIGLAGLAEFLASVPVIADVLAGVGPLAKIDEYGYPRRDHKRTFSHLRDVAGYVAGRMGIDLAILHISRVSSQLLVTISWLGGTTTADRLARFAPGLSSSQLFEALDQLERHLLIARPTRTDVSLRPGVIGHIHVPGHARAHSLSWMSKADVGRQLVALGLPEGVNRKDARDQALLDGLSNPEVIARVLSALPPPARAMFHEMLAYEEVHIQQVGLPIVSSSYLRPNTAFGQLFATGLVGVDASRDRCWVWLDVRVGLTGSIFYTWDAPPPSATVAIDPDQGGLAPSVRTLDKLVASIRAKPPAALKSGGMGVAVMRSLAKQAGVTVGEVGLLITLANEMRLVESVVVRTNGRGRNQTVDQAWTTTAVWDAYAALDAVSRWRLLVQAWSDSSFLLPGEALPDRFDQPDISARGVVQRRAFVGYLAALPPGSGIAETDIATLLYRTSAAFRSSDVVSIVAAARFLSVVPPSGAVGVTSAARAALLGQSGTDDGDEESTFVVQADHTVVVPPNLDPVIEARLDVLADLESSGSARLYRITASSVVKALDTGLSAADITEFLTRHSAVKVASNVLRTITDAANQHGVLRVGGASSWVVSDDPVALAAALSVKVAQLMRVNATTAVSSLSEADLVAALRAKKLSPVSDAELLRRLQSEAAVEYATTTHATLVLRPAILGSTEERIALAAHLVDAPIPPPPAPKAISHARERFDAMQAARAAFLAQNQALFDE